MLRLRLLSALAAGFVGGAAAVWFLPAVEPASARQPALPPPPPIIEDKPPVPPADRFEPAVARVMPSVVAVEAVKPSPGGKGKPNEESGSGVLIRLDNYKATFAVTNNHVVGGAKPADIYVTLADGRILQPDRVFPDPESDIALLRLADETLPVATLGDSDKVKQGQWVLAFGSPLGFSQTVTHGIVSARDRGQISLGNTIRIKEFLQSDAAINPGSSGGPLANSAGEIIGINTAIAAGNQATEPQFTGIAFSIPINLVKRVGRQLIEKGSVSRGYLGMQMNANLDARTALRLGLTKLRGAMVESVHPGGPAARGGLQAGDVIQKLDGLDIRDENHFINLVGVLPGGSSVRLQLWRNKQAYTVDVTVGDWPGGRK